MTVTDGSTNETNQIEITKLEGDDLEMDYVLSRTISQQGVTNTTVFDRQATFKRQQSRSYEVPHNHPYH